VKIAVPQATLAIKKFRCIFPLAHYHRRNLTMTCQGPDHRRLRGCVRQTIAAITLADRLYRKPMDFPLRTDGHRSFSHASPCWEKPVVRWSATATAAGLRRSKDTPARDTFTIRGDVLWHVRVGCGNGFASRISVVYPKSLHVGARDVKPCGTSTNRNVVPATAATVRTARSTPVGCTEIFSEHRLGADPREARRTIPRQQPALPPVAGAPARDTGNSAGDGTGGPIPSSATSGPHTTAANAGPPPGMPCCNTAPADAGAGTTARSLSAGTADASACSTLAPDAMVNHDDQ